MKKISALFFAFCCAMSVYSEELPELSPLPYNSDILTFFRELTESALQNTKNNEWFNVFNTRFAYMETGGMILEDQIWLPVFGHFYIPFFIGFQMEGSLKNDVELPKDFNWLGLLFGTGLFYSGKYGHLGFAYLPFLGTEIFSRTNLSEIPYLGKVAKILEGFFSFDDFIESFSTSATHFKPAYKATMLFADLPIGGAILNLGVYSQQSYYDIFAKHTTHGAKMSLAFMKDARKGTIWLAQAGYREYYDVFIPQKGPPINEYENGISMKLGVTFIDYVFLQLFVESSKRAILAYPVINAAIGGGGFDKDWLRIEFAYDTSMKFPQCMRVSFGYVLINP